MTTMKNVKLRKLMEQKRVQEEQQFSEEELANSKRIYKSATPKGGLDWYIKWASTVCVLSAVTIRSSGIPELQVYDLMFSWLGAIGWFIVSYIWKDRALILLNGVMGVLLFSGLIRYFFG
jgi:hypothetical protein